MAAYGRGRASLAGAYGQAVKEEELSEGRFGTEQMNHETTSPFEEKAEASPSPAPRPKFRSRESDESRVAKIIGGGRRHDEAGAAASQSTKIHGNDDDTNISAASVDSLDDFGDATMERKLQQFAKDQAALPAAKPRNGGRESDEQRMAKLRQGFRRYDRTEAAVPRPAAYMNDDNTHSTTVSGSSFGDVEDSTIERKILQHSKDIARKNAILRSSIPSLVKKDDVLRSSDVPSRKNSASSLESEPRSVRTGGTWGSKARLGTGWMKAIVSPDDSEELDFPQRSAPHRNIAEDSVDWAGAAADVPLPSLEGNSTLQEPTPPHSRPSSAQPSSASPQKSLLWDAELDFTAKSLQISTSPQLKIRNTKIDEITAREIETLSKRAVATNRLEEIRERNSVSPEVTRSPAGEPTYIEAPDETSSRGDNLASRGVNSGVLSFKREPARRVINKEAVKAAAETEEKSRTSLENSSRNSLSKESITAALLTPAKLRKSHSPKEALEQPRTSVSANDAGDKDLPSNMALESKSTDAFVKDNAPIKTSQSLTVEPEINHEMTILEEEGERIPNTPVTVFSGAAAKNKLKQPHTREDSFEALQRLSRLHSSSPLRYQSELASNEAAKDAATKADASIPIDIKRLSATSTPPKSDVDPEERIAAEISLFELQDNKSERNSLRAPSPDDYSDGVDETPRPKSDPLLKATPVVTGAYIQTPAPPRGREPGPLSSHPIRNPPRGRSTGSKSRPRPINTAKPASVAEDLRKILKEANIDDSSTDDFDGLLEAAAVEFDVDSAPAQERLSKPLSEKERRQRTEEDYERMARKVGNNLYRMRDVKRGLERLEDQVLAVAEVPHTESPVVWMSLPHMPMPRLFVRDPTKWTGLRLTWIGLLLFVIFTWLLAESAVCSVTCKPTYASRNTWHINDPLWGMALPTLITRLTRGMVSVPGTTDGAGLTWLWSWWTDGEQINVDAAKGVLESSWDTGTSMMNDEVL